MHVFVEFLGGPLDGKTYDGNSTNRFERDFVSFVWLCSDQGSIGKGFNGINHALLQELGYSLSDLEKPHIYKYLVEEKLVEGEQVLVRLRHFGTSTTLNF